MQVIIPPIEPGASGPAAQNLVEAILLLVERAVIRSPVGAGHMVEELAQAAKPERDAAKFGPATRRLVLLLQQSQGLGQVLEGRVEERTAELINRILTDLGVLGGVQPPPPPPVHGPPDRRIFGTALFQDGSAADNLPLRLYRLGFGGQANQIGDDSTAADGTYSINYSPADARSGLQLRAIGPDNQEVTLTRGLFDLPGEAKVDLVAPSKLRLPSTEYQRLSSDIIPVVGEIAKLKDAREDDEREDVSLLHRATGWDGRLLAIASNAAGLAGDGLDVSHEAMYGMLRAGLPSDRDALARLEPETVKAALQKSATAGVTALKDADIAQAVGSFETFARASRLGRKVEGTISSPAEMIEASSLSADKKKKFADVYAGHTGTADQLWEKAAAAGLAPKDVDALKSQGKLAFLTLNNQPLMGKVQELARSDPAKLVAGGFDRSETWAENIRTIAGNGADALNAMVPAAYAADTPEERLSLYADDLARKVRIAFPTHVLAATVERDQNDTLQLGSDREPTSTLLSAAASAGFVLGQQPLAKFVSDNPAVLSNIPNDARAGALRGATELQRIHQLTPGNDAMMALSSAGFKSAFDVVALSQDAFVAAYGKHFKDDDEARLVHRKAEQVSAVTYNLFAIAKKMDGDIPVYGMSAAPPELASVKDQLIKQFPTMESLFGSMDFCACEHCRSVLGPAAYLVDLFQFLDPEPLLWNNFLADWKAKHGNADYLAKYKKPYDALIERRPDLAQIQLTCENTTTAMPYIDLVNEILEYFVANGALDEKAARDTGSATTAELLAEPQYVIASAYEELRKDLFPLDLPFDLWLETVRAFSDHFDTPFASVLETLRRTDELFDDAQPYAVSDILFEGLSLAPAEIAIFANPDPLANWYELYGFDTAAEALTTAFDAAGQHIDLNSAKALSRRLNVDYETLAEIIVSRFVNPQIGKIEFLHKVGVSVQDVFNYKAAKPLYAANKDLIGKDRSTLSSADQLRFDALSPADWASIEDSAALLARLAEFTDTYQSSGIDFENYVETGLTDGSFSSILVLADPDAGCDFDKTMVQFADGTKVDPLSLLKINLLVRLWKKLGWSIADTDRALTTFIPKNAPFEAASFGDLPLRSALIGIAGAKALHERLHSSFKTPARLLALWSDLSIEGPGALYPELFLHRGTLVSDTVFDDPLAHYLQAPGHKLKDHVAAVQGALAISGEDIGLILDDLKLNPDDADLTLGTVSMLYRYKALAKAVGLTVRDFIALKQLSGFDPFANVKDGPVEASADDVVGAQTTAFVDIAAGLKEFGIKLEELDYILRHVARNSQTAKRRDNEDLALIHDLASAIRAIERDNSLPASGSLSDDELRAKLMLIYPAPSVDRLMAMLSGTVQTKAVVLDVKPADALTLERFVSEPSITDVTYDPVLERQTLTITGMLFDGQRTDLTARLPDPPAGQAFAPSSVFDDLLKDAQAQQQAFFTTNFQKQPEQPLFGFLEEGDFKTLFEPPAANASDDKKEALKNERRAKLSAALLPVLRQRLKRGSIVDTIGSELALDPALAEVLVGDPNILGAPAPLLDTLSNLAGNNVTASFYSDVDATTLIGSPAELGDVDTNAAGADGNVAMPAAAKSTRFTGYFEVPVSGAYRFFAALDKKDAQASLSVDGAAEPIFQATATSDGFEASVVVELKSGMLHEFELVLTNLGTKGGRLQILGEALPKGPLSNLTLLSGEDVSAARGAATLVRKAARIVDFFTLSTRELRYFTTHSAAFDGFDLKTLPVEADDPSSNAPQARFKFFKRLPGYARVKRDFAAGSDGLIDVFEASSLQTAFDLLAELALRDSVTIQAAAEKLFAAPDFKDERPIARLTAALGLSDAFGLPVPTLASWAKIVDKGATADERFEIARDVRDAVKAGIQPGSWGDIAQPIFDKLRSLQRDALSAHVMSKLKLSRRDQLYEYFLIDPGMEPVVQTSRIRLALGSVQLFIHRTLLNLEPKVLPETIDAAQWQWMSRYRVWEANRKIFLFPENWLEPEFRTGKSNLFSELEGALLQGDVSDDLVEDVLFTYLQKLDELAKLELVAMHLEDSADPAGRKLHLIGRTPAASPKYFYRRFVHGTWTPWEPITPKIDGSHLAPVIWRDRLYLFWVTFEFRPDPPSDVTVIDPSVKVKIPAPTQQVDLKLHWASYFKGRWSAAENSEPMTAMLALTLNTGGFYGGMGSGPIVSFPVTFSMPLTVPIGFDVSGVPVHVSKEAYEDGEERGVNIHLGGAIAQTIYLAGRHARPVLNGYPGDPLNPYSAKSVFAARFTGYGALSLSFNAKVATQPGQAPVDTPVQKTILGKGGSFTILPCNSPLNLGTADFGGASNEAAVAAAAAAGIGEIAILSRPFIYQDVSTVLFVEPDVTERTYEQWEDWAVPDQNANPLWSTPNWWNDLPLVAYQPSPKPVPVGPVDYLPDVANLYAFNQTPASDWLTNPKTAVEFGGSLIGRSGRAEAGAAALDSRAAAMRPEDRRPLASLDAAPTHVVTSAGLNSSLHQLNERIR